MYTYNADKNVLKGSLSVLVRVWRVLPRHSHTCTCTQYDANTFGSEKSKPN